MPLTETRIKKLINEIKEKTQPESKYYGKLLEWYDGFANHYGIGLNDQEILSTGEHIAVILHDNRPIKFCPTLALPPDLVIARLIQSLDCFKDWNYGLLGWNCEHYGRLIATNKAKSYQVKYSPLAIFNHGGYNPDALRVFNQYLKSRNLDNLIVK